jgi:hypothetical protein
VFLSNLHSFTLTVALSLLPLHTHCTLFFSRFTLLSFTHVYRRKENINIMAAKDRVVDGGEGG